ncbi:MAG: pyruvate/ketoisovalerate oxidoreductase, gamma subunit [Deltaproteobacteria bacterium]|jgi:pyruvate ferredoxin oxidoreductase gamma subunit|nr:pyruvate/ketoisovalerate oxidoreductase, gamma subunit [Deltaproteobacteria bacterium]
MIEVRFHGRGGQGAVTSAEIAAQAAINEGLYAQAFPNFGPERRGAPVMAFLRVSPAPIKTRSRVYTPDVIVILDPTLLLSANPAAGLKPNGFVVININKPLEEIRKQFAGFKVAAVDASKIAKEEMGVPITNTTMLGSLIRATKIISIESLDKPIRERFGLIAQKNISAYTRAYNETVVIE